MALPALPPSRRPPSVPLPAAPAAPAYDRTALIPYAVIVPITPHPA